MAGTVIDSLVVTLALDGSQYKQGAVQAQADLKNLSETTTGVAKDLESKGSQAGEFFGKMRREALGLFAIIAGGRGMQELLSNAVQTSVAYGNMATNIGMSARALSAFGNLATQNGGNADATTNSIFGLSQQIEGAKLGQRSQAVATLSRYMGINPNQPVEKVMEDIAGWMQKHSPQQDAFIGQSLGLDMGTVNMLRTLGPQGVAQGLATQGTTDDPAVAAAKAITKSFGQLQVQIDQLSNDLMVKATPGILKALSDFTMGIWGIDQVIEGKMTWGQLFQDAVTKPAEQAIGGSLDAQQASTRDQLMKFFMGKGLTQAQAAGVVGNAFAESSLNPTATNGDAKGLFQWTGPRAAAFQKMYGVSPDKATVQQQEEFAWMELKAGEGGALDALDATNTPGDAGAAFAATFERPYAGMGARAIYADEMKRAQMSQMMYQQYAPAAPAPVVIKQITIHTKATDAPGIARSIAPAIKKNVKLVHQADHGLN
jgi:hypothetical protein